MKNKRKIALLLVTIVLAALLCACAGDGIAGEWKNEATGIRIVFDKNGTAMLYTPLFGTETENKLTYTVDGDQLTIVFINLDGSASDETTVVISDNAFTYMKLQFAKQD